MDSPPNGSVPSADASTQRARQPPRGAPPEGGAGEVSLDVPLASGLRANRAQGGQSSPDRARGPIGGGGASASDNKGSRGGKGKSREKGGHSSTHWKGHEWQDSHSNWRSSGDWNDWNAEDGGSKAAAEKPQRERKGKGKGGKRGDQWQSDWRGQHNNQRGDGQDDEAEQPQRDRKGKGGGRGQRQDAGSKHDNQSWQGHAASAPSMLGVSIKPALAGFPLVVGGPEFCILCCADKMSFVGMGSCGHTDVCWVCTMRMRSLAHDHRCPVCKEELDEVVITANAKATFPTESALRKLPCDSAAGVRFADEDVQQAVMRLFEYRCRYDYCAQASTAFRSLKELEDHMWYKHWGQLCKVCLEGRSAFLFEQRVYLSKDMERHNREGDPVHISKQYVCAPVPSHPKCDFCNRRFFDADELTRHMHECHHLCHLCGNMGRHNEFFKTVKALARHYAESHYVCVHKDCSHGGHRLTAFTTEEELNLHTHEKHGDGTLTDKPTIVVGVRSYAQERALNAASGAGGAAGKGGGRASAEEVPTRVRFAWPKSMPEEEGEEWDGSWLDDILAVKYPERDILPEVAMVDEASTGEAEEKEEDSDSSESNEDEGQAPVLLSRSVSDKVPARLFMVEDLEPAVDALTLDCTVAPCGQNAGMRSCLDALHAVVQALGSHDHEEDECFPALRSVVSRLSLGDLERLERVHKDLNSDDLGRSCNWEPLERVLSLRPLFFRLLRSVKGAQPTPKKQAIGPQAGAAKEEDRAEKCWRAWRTAAQGALKGLGKKELLRLRTYIALCVRRRWHMCNNQRREAEETAASFPALSTAHEPQPPPEELNEGWAEGEAFPALGGGKQQIEGPGSGWGRPKAPAVPKRDAAMSFPALSSGSGLSKASSSPAKAQSLAPKASAPKAPKASAPKAPSPPIPDDWETLVDDFPSLGGGGGSSPMQQSWGGKATSSAKAVTKQPSAPSTAPKPVPKPAAKSSFQDLSEASFPDLGGSSATRLGEGSTWGAQAKARVAQKATAKAPLEPAKPKVFKAEEESFPELPTAAPKPKSSAAKAGAKAKSGKVKLNSLAQQKAKLAHEAAEVEEEEDVEVPNFADEELVVIHDPLTAVAKTEAERAQREAEKAARKGKRRMMSAMSAWAASS